MRRVRAHMDVCPPPYAWAVVQVINWEAFDEAGVINARDVDELLFTDSVDEAFDHIVKAIGSRGPLSPNR